MNMVADISATPAWRVCLQEIGALCYTLYNEFSLNGRQLAGGWLPKRSAVDLHRKQVLQ